MKILAIETSCDETAISIVEFKGSRQKPSVKILSNIISSQVKLHVKFGGIVPNLAKREHQKNLPAILLNALRTGGFSISKSKFLIFKKTKKLKIKKIEKILEREPELLKRFKKYILPLKSPDINEIAVTYGPGLAPALWVGVNFAKALAYFWNKPLIPINHMEGHLYSALLQKGGVNSHFLISNFQFPALALLVSGGHTELVLMKKFGNYKIIGETLDDAAGEAFDKVARLLGLGYPGGPQIARLAQFAQKHAEPTQSNAEIIPRRFALSLRVSASLRLPRPMIASGDYNFSFSGLKTAVLYLTRDLGPQKTKKNRPLVAKEFQDAVVEVLVKKTISAAKKYKAKTILLGGGVAANRKLREDLVKTLVREIPSAQCLLPDISLTGDNALMIALAAYFSGKKIAPEKFGAKANLRLG